MLSPAGAVALLLYLMRIVLPLSVPESSTPVIPTVPVGKVQKYPVAGAVVVLPAGNAGAVYLYILLLQVSETCTIETLAGADGTAMLVFVNLMDFVMLLPQSEVYNTLILSPVAALRLLVYVTIMI